MEKGSLSVNSENLLPIIKKWLYSDMDIFLRELVSNACDALTKLDKLVKMGDAANDEKLCVKVILNAEEKTIKIVDNGIGMTAEEIDKYINQIAVSSAEDFLEKYKDKIDADKEIIGHFGLGFYSAFMVSDKVRIDSLSYAEGAQAATWVCEGAVDYEMGQGEKTGRGTEITLYINEESKELLSTYKLRTILKKYCGFMPFSIYLVDENEKAVEKEDGTLEVKEPEAVNNTTPLWAKAANDITDEEYKAFYHEVFTDFDDPLFWIHLNMDYPFRLKGILYFPRLKNELETIEGQVKLYCNQVFVADNVKEVVPEFLLLLKGALDCPDIPLNVSRSFLQNDTNVAKMSGYITRKVADKLNSMFKNQRDSYASYWDDISVFIKYGCIKDKSFYDKVSASLLYKTASGEYLTLEEYTEKNGGAKEVYYVTDETRQAPYIKLFKEQGIEAVMLNTVIDAPFISYLESYLTDIKFYRIDSDANKSLKSDEEGSEGDDSNLTAIFTESLNKPDLKITAESLKNESTPAIAVISEQSIRLKEMSRMFKNSDFPLDEKLIINKNNSLIKALPGLLEKGRKEDAELICKQVYDLALMSLKPLTTEEMSAFMERSNKILEILAK